MAQASVYLSVMTPAASSGDINLTFETLDAGTNIVLSATITGVNAGDGETTIARKIQSQMDIIFVQQGAAYGGKPVLSDQPYLATFRQTRSEHCIGFWSQAQFTITIDSNDTGCIMVTGEPSLCTVRTAKDVAAINGVTLTANSIPLTDVQIALLIQQASAELISYLHNPIIISTFLGEFSGNDERALQLKPKPALSCDAPNVRRKYIDDVLAFPDYSPYVFNFIRAKSMLYFRPNESFVNAFEPFARDNEIRFTYTAGYSLIPTEIIRACVQFSNLLLHSGNETKYGGISSVQGGSFKVTFDHKQYSSKITQILLPVQRYIM